MDLFTDSLLGPLSQRMARAFKRYPRTSSTVVFIYITFGAYAVVDTIRRGDVFRRFVETFHYSTTSLAIALIAGMGTTIPILLRYLRSDTEKRELGPDVDFERHLIWKFRHELDELRAKFAGLSSSGEGVDVSEALSEFREEVSEAIFRRVTAELGKEFEKKNSRKECHALFMKDQGRLIDQLSTLRRRGNLNLVIGVTTTLGAIFVLILTVYSVRSVHPSSPELIAYFVPRISTVVFVEVFSFFFLRLYKTTLEEEKYYQGEITTRSSFQIAFEAAVEFDLKDSLPNVIGALAVANKPSAVPNVPPPTSQFDLKELGALVEAASKVIVTVAKSRSV